MFRFSSPRGSIEGLPSVPGSGSFGGSERFALSDRSAGPEAAALYQTDESFDDYGRVVHYSLSSLPLQRLVFLKRLSLTAHSAGLRSCLVDLIPICIKLQHDSEAVIRQALAAEIANLCRFLFDPRSPPLSSDPLSPDDIPELAAALETLPSVADQAAAVVSGQAPITRLCRATEPADFSESFTFVSSRVSRPSDSRSSAQGEFLADKKGATEADNDAAADRSLTLSLWSAAYWSIVHELIPILERFLSDSNGEVRQAACEALVSAARFLTEEDIGKFVLTGVLNLAHDEKDDQRSTAVQLLHQLAPLLGLDLCRSFVALELAALADDATFKVRKATAQSFGNVALTVGPEFCLLKLMPNFARLSRDSIWGVRKGCVESVIALTKVLNEPERRSEIIPLFERLAKDTSRWVRNGAYEILGELLHALGPQLCSKELVALYASIPNLSSAIVDSDVNYHCAFTFPAVLLTIGADRFESELLGCFRALCKDSKVPVRRCMASSIHLVAEILGPERTELFLIDAIEAFLRDCDEVKFSVVKHFSLFLRCVTASKRDQFIEHLWIIQKLKTQWRFRLQWAKQAKHFILLFESDTLASAVTPLLFSLCRDSVSIVRNLAARSLGSLIARLTALNSVAALPAVEELKHFAASNSHFDRQLFVIACEFGASELPNQLLHQHFEPLLVDLAQDKVSSVRLQLAAAAPAFAALSEPIREANKKLQSDVNHEVSKIAANAELKTMQTNKPENSQSQTAETANCQMAERAERKPESTQNEERPASPEQSAEAAAPSPQPSSDSSSSDSSSSSSSNSLVPDPSGDSPMEVADESEKEIGTAQTESSDESTKNADSALPSPETAEPERQHEAEEASDPVASASPDPSEHCESLKAETEANLDAHSSAEAAEVEMEQESKDEGESQSHSSAEAENNSLEQTDKHTEQQRNEENQAQTLSDGAAEAEAEPRSDVESAAAAPLTLADSEANGELSMEVEQPISQTESEAVSVQ